MDAAQLLRRNIINCKSECSLREGAIQIVPGVGSIQTRIMIIGEAPGEQEDVSGAPFVGVAGELLTTLLQAVDIIRPEIYITNICKCRPPNNRTPLYKEVKACEHHLEQEFKVVQPDVIVTLGNTAKNALVAGMPGINKCHGWMMPMWVLSNKVSQPVKVVNGGIYEMRMVTYLFTYHPSYIIRSGGIGSKMYETTVADLEGLVDFYDPIKRWSK